MKCSRRTRASPLNLTLTTRDRNKPEDQRTPMCGVPYHSAEAYIARLIAKGYKVAICEQTEDPAQAKGLVDREIIRVVTPGTLIEENLLEEGKNNYICGIYADSAVWGLCLCDISTGEVYATSFPAGRKGPACALGISPPGRSFSRAFPPPAGRITPSTSWPGFLPGR